MVCTYQIIQLSVQRLKGYLARGLWLRSRAALRTAIDRFKEMGIGAFRPLTVTMEKDLYVGKCRVNKDVLVNFVYFMP